MANQVTGSVKRVLITQNNSRMFVALAVAAVVFSFTVVTSVNMVKRMTYQAKVISKRSEAEKQLKANIEAADKLVTSYKDFDDDDKSIILTNDKNSKIVLDALPSKYDFPALATSLENMVKSVSLSNIIITGIDNEAGAEQNSSSPSPVEIPFTISAKGKYLKIQELITDMQRSIRPFKMQQIEINAGTGGNEEVTVLITAITHYQPEKNLEIPLEEVQ